MPFVPYKNQPSEPTQPQPQNGATKVGPDTFQTTTTKKSNILTRVSDMFNQRAMNAAQALNTKQSFGSKAFQAASEFAGLGSDVIVEAVINQPYQLAATVHGALDPNKTRADFINQDRQLVDNIMSSKFGQDAIAAMQKLSDQVTSGMPEEKKRNFEAALRIGDFVTNFLGASVAKKAATEATKVAGKEAVKAGVKAGEVALSTGSKLANKGVKVASDIAEKVTPQVVTDLSRGIKETGFKAAEAIKAAPERIATNAAAMKLEREAIDALPEVARQPVRNGVLARDAALVLEDASDAQKGVMKEMAEKAVGFADNRLGDPAESMGNVVRQNIDEMEKIVAKQGRELGKFAAELPDTAVVGTRDNVLQQLRSVPGLENITASPTGTLNFKGTVLTTAATKADRKFIQDAFNGLMDKAGKMKSAADLHKLRQELFQVLDGKKAALSGQGYTEAADKAVNAIRKGISDTLDAAHPGYKVLNEQFAKAISPLERIKKFYKGVNGTDESILNAKGGLLLRRLTSNVASAPELREIFQMMDDILSLYGKKKDINLTRLQDFYNALARYYDISKDTSLAGQVKLSMQDIPTGPKGIIDKTLGKAVEFAGVSPEVRKKAFEDLLRVSGIIK